MPNLDIEYKLVRTLIWAAASTPCDVAQAIWGTPATHRVRSFRRF